MTQDPSEFDLRQFWQGQKKELEPMALAEIHAKARKLETRVNSRNAMEYVACGLVVIGFAPALLHGSNWMIQAGAGLIMLGTLVVAWQLHRRASVDATPCFGEALLENFRRQLIRQRDALRSVAVWYLGPLIPGLLLLLTGFWFRPPPHHETLAQYRLGSAIVDAVIVAVYLGVWQLNLWGARRLQKRIDDLG